jgi:hypothetical protein
MKVWSLVVATALALCACGRGGGATAGASTVAGPDAAGDCEHVTIRLLGTNPRDVSSLRLGVESVTAACAGERVEVVDAPCGRTLDLSSDATAYDLGRLPFRRDGAHVTVAVHVAGGSACKEGQVGDLGGCLAPITFELDPARVDHDRCHALILLDVGRSVANDGAGLVLLPNLRVFY